MRRCFGVVALLTLGACDSGASAGVTVDDAPEHGAIFEGDCGGGGQGYGWRLLNERADCPCVYVQDPWAPQWDAGVHEVAFSYRESIALGRIVVTNDPEYAP